MPYMGALRDCGVGRWRGGAAWPRLRGCRWVAEVPGDPPCDGGLAPVRQRADAARRNAALPADRPDRQPHAAHGRRASPQSGATRPAPGDGVGTAPPPVPDRRVVSRIEHDRNRDVGEYSRLLADGKRTGRIRDEGLIESPGEARDGQDAAGTQPRLATASNRTISSAEPLGPGPRYTRGFRAISRLAAGKCQWNIHPASTPWAEPTASARPHGLCSRRQEAMKQAPVRTP